MSGREFERLTLVVLREIFGALREIRDGLEFPDSESVAFQLDDVARAVRDLETAIGEDSQ